MYLILIMVLIIFSFRHSNKNTAELGPLNKTGNQSICFVFHLSPNDNGFSGTAQTVWRLDFGDSRIFKSEYHCHEQWLYGICHPVSVVMVTWLRYICEMGQKALWGTWGTRSLTLLTLNTSDNWRWMLNACGWIILATRKLRVQIPEDEIMSNCHFKYCHHL